MIFYLYKIAITCINQLLVSLSVCKLKILEMNSHQR